MPDVVTDVIDAMRAAATRATARMPDSMALAIPLRPLAEAAIKVLSGADTVPAIPTYRHDVASERKWYGVVTSDEREDGAEFSVLSVTRQGSYAVVELEYDGRHTLVRLPSADAADFGLSVTSAAYAPDQPLAEDAEVEAAPKNAETPGFDESS